MTPLEDAYRQYRELGFIMRKSSKDKKHAYRKGQYIDAVNEEFDPTATGYVAIVPPEYIIIDNDKYEEANRFDLFIEDLGYTPEPFANTPSGGEHYIFENPYSDMVIGDTKRYTKVDCFAGYQSVIPVVGTVVLNKQNIRASYTWHDDMLESIIVNKWDDKLLTMLNMRERAVTGEHQGTRDELEQAIIDEDMPTEQVDLYLSQISHELDHKDWVEVGMALYDRYDGSSEGRAKWVAWCESSPKFNKSGKDRNYGASKWDNGNLVPKSITYKRLRNMATEHQGSDFLKQLSTMKTNADIAKIVKQISDTPKLNTRHKADNVVRDELSVKINLRMKELKKDDPSIKVAQARTIVKELNHRATIEELEEKGEGVDMAVYLRGNYYCLRVKNTVVEDLVQKNVTAHCSSLGINPMITAAYMQKATAIAGIKKETDYLLDARAGFELQHSGAVHELRYLHLLTNPLSSIQEPAEREDIIKDFFEDIWHGKAEDIIRLIGLTMRFKETKLNKIHVVAPSNTGKTTFLENIGFQTIHMKRLVQALNADKGIGKPVIDGLKSSGFLLIDETNDPLTQDIKNIDNYISLDQFGQGGTQEIKLHFTCMTSTHKSAVRGMSDEMYNRMLLIELKKDESKFTIDKSELFIHDTEAYTETLIQHTKWMLKDALTNPKYTKKDLRKLQEKYRLELNNDVDEMLLEVSGKVMEEFKTLATAEGDVVERNGDYFIRRKTDVHDAIANRLGEYSHIDQGKYGDALMSHFITDERKNIKIHGKSVKFYKFKMKKYYANDEQEIVDMFDDLDAEEL